ncbi:MAG TPA: ATP-grasp fold amidoligase family protein [bacterium]|nr:ATP-grasp fold amidoligase family protein [bacterium]
MPEPALIALAALRGHKRTFGVYPNLISPKTFSEKVLYRLIFDRRPLLITLQDKYAVRDYVRDRIGEHMLPRLYWVTKTPADIPFDDLPDKFVVKATHGSGWVHLVPDKARLDRRDLLDRCTCWLRWNYYNYAREWAYKHIEPRIIVEEFISDGRGPAPVDYKFYVFGGKVHLIYAIIGRFIDVRNNGYTRSWDRIEMKTRGKSIDQPMPRPPHLDEMLEYAERLGDGLDFLRVDLYDAGKVYFGEMTLYPSAGGEFFDPKWNRYFGELWNLRVRSLRRDKSDSVISTSPQGPHRHRS